MRGSLANRSIIVTYAVLLLLIVCLCGCGGSTTKVQGTYASLESATEKALTEFLDRKNVAFTANAATGQVEATGVKAHIDPKSPSENRPRSVKLKITEDQLRFGLYRGFYTKTVRKPDAERAVLAAIVAFVETGDEPLLMSRVTDRPVSQQFRFAFDSDPTDPAAIASLCEIVAGVRGRPFLRPPTIAYATRDDFARVFDSLHSGMPSLKSKWINSVGATYDFATRTIFVDPDHHPMPKTFAIIAGLGEALEHQYADAAALKCTRWGETFVSDDLQHVLVATAGSLTLSRVIQSAEFDVSRETLESLIAAAPEPWAEQELKSINERPLRGLLFVQRRGEFAFSALDDFYFGTQPNRTRLTSSEFLQDTSAFESAQPFRLSTEADEKYVAPSRGMLGFRDSREPTKQDYADELRGYLISVVNEFMAASGRPLVVTSGHRDDSTAHQEGAIDYRSRDISFEERHAEAQALSEVLGEDFTVIVEEGYSPTEYFPALGVGAYAPMRVLTAYSAGKWVSSRLGKYAATHTHVQRRAGLDIVQICAKLGLKPESPMSKIARGMKLGEPIHIDIDVAPGLAAIYLRARTGGGAFRRPESLGASGARSLSRPQPAFNPIPFTPFNSWPPP